MVRITSTLGQASGVLITPDEVLTASHVVYAQGTGAATGMHITPEASQGLGIELAPAGYALAATIHYNLVLDGNGTETFAQSQYDYAVIHLSEAFPSLGTMAIEPDFNAGPVDVLGYPALAAGDLDFSTIDVQRNDTYSILQGSTVGTLISPGSSGGPAFTGGLSNPAVVGLVSTGGGGTEQFTQITQSVFNQIADWVRADDGTVLQAVGSTPVPPPLPPPVTGISVQGNHGDYIVANASGSLYLADTVPGRDGAQTLAGVGHITFADGTGRFDAIGGAEQTARLYQAAFDRPADLGGLDNWADKIDMNTLGIAQVAADFIVAPEFSARYGAPDDTGFVQQLYQNVLGRAPDAGGLENWLQVLGSGTARSQVLTDFSESFENRVNTEGSIGDADLSEATRLYQAAFDRAPDAGGLAAWTTRLDQGETAPQIAADMSRSSEFAADYAGLDAAGFVAKLYLNALHRAGDAGGVRNWVDQLQSGQSRASVLLAFSDSIENRVGTAHTTHDAWVFLPS